jgi:hypothetical protein
VATHANPSSDPNSDSTTVPDTTSSGPTVPNLPSNSGNWNGGPIDVNTDAIHRGAQQYREVAQLTASVSERLRMLAAEKPLQNGQADDTWTKFYGEWGPKAFGLARNVNSLSRTLYSTADGLDAMADGFATAEDSAVEAAENLGREMDG